MSSHFIPLVFESISPINAVQVLLIWLLFHRAINSLDFSTSKKRFLSFLVAFVLFGWLGLATIISQSGFFQQLTTQIPNIGLLFVPIAVGLTLLRSSQTFQKIVDALWMPGLIAVQFFRLLGIYFLILYGQGLMPAEFAFPSGYGDILIGLTAPVVGYLYFLKKSYSHKLAVIWNYVGILDLAIAIVTGFFSYSSPYQLLAHNLPNDLLFAYPLALVPTFAVPLSILLHFFSLRKLAKTKAP